jgi:DNA-binding transcriptional MocR family regulator
LAFSNMPKNQIEKGVQIIAEVIKEFNLVDV